MAKYRLTSDSRRSVDCDILNESADQYVVRFGNGVIRCVDKRNVYAFDKIDEAVLDDIRGVANKVGGAIKRGYQAVKLFVSKMFMSGDKIVVCDNDGEVIDAVHPGNMLTSENAQNAPINVIPGRSLAEAVVAAGGRPVVINNYEFPDDEFAGYGGLANESADIDWHNAIYERFGLPSDFNDVRKNARAKRDMGDGMDPEHVNLVSKAGFVNMVASDICDAITKEYNERLALGENCGASAMRIWGAPGIGKSAIMKGLSERLGKDVTTIVINGNALGSHDLYQTGHIQVDLAMPSEADVESKINSIMNNAAPGGEDRAGVVGSATLDDKRRVVKVDKVDTLPQVWLPVYNSNQKDPVTRALEIDTANGAYVDRNDVYHEGKGGILFIDEYSRLSNAAKNSLMTLASDRVISNNGSMKLGPRWVVVAAANRPEDMSKANYRQYTDADDPADRNRFRDINYIPLPSEWFKWAESKPKRTDYKTNVEPEIIAYVKYSISDGQVVPGAEDGDNAVYDNYANFAKSDFYNFQKNGNAGTASQCTPRSWTFFSDAIRQTRRSVVEMTEEEIYELAKPYLGSAPASRFATFVQEMYSGFSARDAHLAVTVGNTNGYDFIKNAKNGEPWITSENVEQMATVAIIPRIMTELDECIDDQNKGFYSDDAIFNVLKFFAYVVEVVCNDGTASNANIFTTLAGDLKSAIKEKFGLSRVPRFAEEIEAWRESTAEALANNTPVDYSDIF